MMLLYNKLKIFSNFNDLNLLLWLLTIFHGIPKVKSPSQLRSTIIFMKLYRLLG